MAPKRRQAIIWTNADPIHWRIYVALSGEMNSKPADGLVPCLVRTPTEAMLLPMEDKYQFSSARKDFYDINE